MIQLQSGNWNLYKDALKSEEPSNPEKTVERVQRISAAVFHLEQVSSVYPEAWGSKTALQNTKFPLDTQLLVSNTL